MTREVLGRTLLTIDQAAAHMEVHPITIRRWISGNRLQAHRVGPRLLKIDLDELEAMLTPVGSVRPSMSEEGEDPVHTKQDDPLYAALYRVFAEAGLWEGDAHELADQGCRLGRWLLHEASGSHVGRTP